MRTHEFWRNRSGGVWAVELVEGVVAGCCGPLDASEIEDEFLPHLEYSAREAEWIEAHRTEFELFEPARPYG